MKEEISRNGNVEELNEREKFISIMILKCGINPEILARRVEEGEERVDYPLGGVSVFRDGREIVARIDNWYVSDKPIAYRWEHER